MNTDLVSLLMVNKAYQETITLILDKLKEQLNQNRHRQAEIQILLSSKQENNDQSNENEIAKIKDSYFKHKFSTRPPITSDTKIKQKLVIYEDVPVFKSEWTQKFCDLLKQSVIKETIRILKTPLINRIEGLNDKLKKLRKQRAHKEVLDAENTLEDIQNEYDTITKLKESEILDKTDLEKINWDKIANKDLDERWTGNVCRLVWINAVNPKINREKWTKDEDDNLRKLARKYHEKNWAKIALELNTGRSAYLCMKQYHEKTALDYCRRDWSDNDIEELLSLTQNYSIGHYIPYNYLCYLIGTRDRPSLYACFCKINPYYNRGKWTTEEENLLVEAMSYYSKQFNWQEISEMVGSRNPFQCKEHYELKYNNPDKYTNWTIEDDIKLLDAYDKYKSHWSKIAKEFMNRNDHACLFRFRRLMMWKKQNEWLEKQPDEIKEFIEWTCRSYNRKDSNREIGYTKNGQLVPRIPAFMTCSSFMSGIVDKIHENKDLVYEFVRQKRNGQLNLALLTKIGVQTHVTQTLTRRYQKADKLPKKRGRPSGVKEKAPKIKKLKNPKEEGEEEKDKKTGLKRKLKGIENKKLDTRLNKKRKVETNLENIEVENENIDENKESIATYSTKDKPIRKKKEPKIKKKLIKITKKRHKESVGTKLVIEGTVEKPEEDETESILPPKITEVDENIEKKVKKPKREKSSLVNKVVKAANDENKPIESEPNEKSKNIIQTKITDKFKKISKEKEKSIVEISDYKQSSLIMKLDDVPENQKIPCLVEQASGYQFLYSLKKDPVNKYLKKYTIINCRGKPVGIKPLNHYVTDEYLTDAKLDLIEKAINKVLNVDLVKRLM